MLLGSGRLPEETLSSWDEVCLVILVFGRGESVEVVVVLSSSFGLLVEAVMASKKRHSLIIIALTGRIELKYEVEKKFQCIFCKLKRTIV